MIALVLAVIAFVAIATVVLRWTEADYRKHRRLTSRSTVATWLLYLLHADSVAVAAFSERGKLEVAEGPLLFVGIVLVGVGVVLFVGAAQGLITRGALEGSIPTRLVTDGVFGLSRHPQNVGWALILLGLSVASRSIVALALTALFAVFVGRLTRIEEADLRSRFGESYEAYRSSTPALLPRPLRRAT